MSRSLFACLLSKDIFYEPNIDSLGSICCAFLPTVQCLKLFF